MPVIAIAGAIIAGIGAEGAVAGIIAGGLSTLSVAGALSIVTAVGATLGAVGAVTGNKGLMTAGMVIGGIGAVGGLASAAGLFDGTASLFGPAAAATDFPATLPSDIAQGTTAVSADTGDILNNLSPTLSESTSADLANAATNGNDYIDALGNVSGNDLTSATGSLINTTPDQALAAQTAADSGQAGAITTDPAAMLTGTTPTTPNPNPAPGAASTTTPTVSAASTTPTVQQPAPTTPVTGVATTSPTTPASTSTTNAPDVTGSVDDIPSKVPITPDVGGSTSIDEATGVPKPGALSGILQFAKDSPMAAYGLLQFGSNTLGGLFSKLTPAQVTALDAQAANNRSQAALTNQQVANMQGGIPTATLGARPPRVTGAPAPLNMGLINSNVTGVPATQ